VQIEDHNEAMAVVIVDTPERDIELLGLTGIEDKLQGDMRQTLELLNASSTKI
jgi:phospholipid-translocating ATPase